MCCGAVKIGDEYTLKSGETSRIYFNLRTPENPKRGPLTEPILLEISDLMLGQLDFSLRLPKELRESLAFNRPNKARRELIQFRYVAGIPNAGDPIADALMDGLEGRSPIEQIRLIKRGRGANRRIVGVKKTSGLVRGAAVLLIDDVLSSAETKIEALQVLRTAGLEVHNLMVVIDREQGGRERLEEYGCQTHAIWRLRPLLEYYVESKWVDSEMAKIALQSVGLAA
jgi:orotate phosphoribosyltransferase